MSMFRSAADISSSDPESSSEEGNDSTILGADDAEPSNSNEELEYDPSKDFEQMLFEEEQAPLGNEGILGNPLGFGADEHATLMTSALLEFFCLTRAADFLNAQTGSLGRFTRESPEVKALGKRMYHYKSQFLTSHGILAGGVDDDDWGRFRQWYRDSLDVIGNEGMSTPPLPGSRTSSITPSLVPSRVPSRTPSRGPEAGPSSVNTLVRAASHEKYRDMQKLYPGYDNQRRPSQGLVHFNHLLRSPNEPIMMTNPQPGSGSDRSSRYASEFFEVKLLGRGSFGQVFEVKHHVDGQRYAVKKIPLSKQRLEMLQQEGVHHFEHILKEIRTLARLDHKNVVRYFGAWVEDSPAYLGSESQGSEPEVDNRMDPLPEVPAEDEQSCGVVFEYSSNGGEDDSKLSSPPQQATASRSGSRTHRRHGSNLTNVSSRGIAEEDDDVESVQRNFNLPEPGTLSHAHTSTWDRTDTGIFTNDMSEEDTSKLQVSLRDLREQTIILHIQMSLHPLTLSTYLSPSSVLRPMKGTSMPRHCFHLLPSLRFFLGILSGVEYLHSTGIVHRDLKPANIFLSSREDAKDACYTCQRQHGIKHDTYRPRIGDFGLVADISHCTDSAATAKDNPKPPRHVGTEFYCPRKASTKTNTKNEYIIDEKLDVFALGVILFELTYRINTRMERQMLLSELTRGGLHDDGIKFPYDFEDKIDYGKVTLANGKSVGQSLSQCIEGMLHPDSRLRYGCRDVRKYLQKLIEMVEESIRW